MNLLKKRILAHLICAYALQLPSLADGAEIIDVDGDKKRYREYPTVDSSVKRQKTESGMVEVNTDGILKQLPNELQYYLGTFLKPCDIICYSQASKGSQDVADVMTQGYVNQNIANVKTYDFGKKSDRKHFLWDIQTLAGTGHKLAIEVQGITQDNLKDLLNLCEHVHYLDLRDNNLNLEQIKTIANAPQLIHLKHLDLEENNLGDEGVQLLINSPYLTNLTSLNLAWNNIDSEGIQALVSSEIAKKLQDLNLTGNHIEVNEGAIIGSSPNLQNLRYLNLLGCRLGPLGVVPIVSSTNLKELIVLNLEANNMDPLGGKNLIDHFALPKLEKLQLGYNEIENSGIQYILDTQKLSKLTLLSIIGNTTTDSGIQTLAHSPLLETLETLDLSYNLISQGTVDHLNNTMKNIKATVDLTNQRQQ